MENMELLQAMRQMLSENNRQMMEEMNRQMAENNRQMMEEMNRQMSENNRQMMEEMHTQIQDAVAPIYSRLDKVDARLDKVDTRLDKVDARLDKVDARLDKVESELQSVKALATKTQLIVENEINRKINLLLEGHNDLHRRVVQLEQMNEILNEVKNDVWAIKQPVSGRVVPYKSRGIRRKPNM